MKASLFFLLIVSVLLVNTAMAQVRTKGYYRKDGTSDRPYYRNTSAADSDSDREGSGNISFNSSKSTRKNSSSYSDNYSKVYRGEHSNQQSQNYNSLLRYNTFSNISMGSSSTIRNNNGMTIGFLEYRADGVFRILDADSVHIGYAKLSNDGRQVRVYDAFGYHVITRYK